MDVRAIPSRSLAIRTRGYLSGCLITVHVIKVSVICTEEKTEKVTGATGGKEGRECPNRTKLSPGEISDMPAFLRERFCLMLKYLLLQVNTVPDTP